MFQFALWAPGVPQRPARLTGVLGGQWWTPLPRAVVPSGSPLDGAIFLSTGGVSPFACCSARCSSPHRPPARAPGGATFFSSGHFSIIC